MLDFLEACAVRQAAAPPSVLSDTSLSHLVNAHPLCLDTAADIVNALCRGELILATMLLHASPVTQRLHALQWHTWHSTLYLGSKSKRKSFSWFCDNQISKQGKSKEKE